MSRPTAASKEEEKTVEQEESKDEANDAKENGAITKRPDKATLESILASDGDTPL